jgi:hypothetical protein
MVNYQRGKIYKLVNDTSDNVYIGSTAQTLAKRIGGHRNDYKKYLEGKDKNITSFKLFENDSKVSIILIEEYPCNNKMELERRERYYIESMKCLNKVVPTRTWKEYKKEYNETNKDKILKHMKEYYETNKDKISEQNKERVKCDICDKELNKSSLSGHKKTQH